jgi:hypothetical protein
VQEGKGKKEKKKKKKEVSPWNACRFTRNATLCYLITWKLLITEDLLSFTILSMIQTKATL